MAHNIGTARYFNGLLSAAAFAASGMVSAGEQLDGPVRFIVPFPAGTSADFIARLFAQPVAERIGQQVVVDNRGGASGTIGAAIGAQAGSNARTWTMGTTTTHAIAPHLNSKLPYHPVKDFAPAATTQELIAHARANPGKLLYASVGNYSLAHLSMEALAKSARITLNHVPYKGSSLAVVDLVAGRVELNFSTMPAILLHVQAGRLRAYAAASLSRLPALPSLPTLAESGFPGFSAALWLGVFVPAATSPALVMRLNREFSQAAAANHVQAQLSENGFEVRRGDPAMLARKLSEESGRWGRVIRDAGVAGI